MHERHLVITADDYGYSEERHAGIIECYENEAVMGASLMVNGVSAQHACQRAALAGMPIGLHLDLTEGKPISPPSRVSTLTNNQGMLHNTQSLRHALQQGSIDMQQVREEMGAQIAKFRELTGGATPRYVDGHQHVHVLPGIRTVFAEVLADHAIQWTRLPLEENLGACTWFEGHRYFEGLTTVVKDAQQSAETYTANGVRYADGFVGMATMGSCMTAERLKFCITQAFQHLELREFHQTPDADDRTMITVELMSHPGYPCSGPGGCGEGPDEFAKSPDRRHEMQILQSSEMKQFYKENNIKLVPYPSL